MQSGVRPTGGQAPVKIYNAVYSSVQVYECMVRGIAVMRRRADAYVNATQILKVAGIDKGRRTKILEKEVLPGKHEIVQGGYGKYQGTWVPLERGRDLATQYGVAPLLAPLFDFTPHPHTLGGLPGGLPTGVPSRPLSASSFTGAGGQALPNSLQPPPILPGSALRLLNQGRAQGLFTPSTSSLALVPASSRPGSQPDGSYPSGYPQSPPFLPGTSVTPPPGSHNLKRSHSEIDEGFGRASDPAAQPPFALAAAPEIQTASTSRPQSATPQPNGVDSHPPAKRPRTDASPAYFANGSQMSISQTLTQVLTSRGSTPLPNGSAHMEAMLVRNATLKNGDLGADEHPLRPASRPLIVRGMDATAPLKDPRRIALVADICSADDPILILSGLRRDPSDDAPPSALDADLILDDQGHTALHLAASMARIETVQALLGCGADVHRGNYNGETPLMRACLAVHNYDHQTFAKLVELLHESIRTIDTSDRSVLHHIVALAGVKNRAPMARFYIDGVLKWIAQRQGGDFKTIVDRQDEHGDTALNIAARVGSRGLVRTLLDVGANRTLSNKLGLRPGDFGVESEELGGGSRAEDILNSLRSVPSGPVQKSQDVIASMTSLIQDLSVDFNAEIKSKQDSLDVTQAHLRAATRELAEQRKQIQLCQARCNDFDQVSQRIRNLATAISEEDRFDWTGRTGKDGKDAREIAGTAFRWRGLESTLPGAPPGSLIVPEDVDAPPPIPVEDTLAAFIRLRRMKLWHARTEQLLNERLRTLQGASLVKELQAKKLVSLCTGFAVDKVEEMVEDLVIALESERQIVDIGRVSGFMQKVRDGII